MSVIIYDTNNWFRVQIEREMSIRPLVAEANRQDGNLRIFVFDGKNCNNYRRQFYPKYKVTRKQPVDTFFQNLEFFRELLSYCNKNTITVKIDGFEADDIIAELSSFYPSVTILSTDKDLLQIKNAKLPMANNKWEDREYIFTKKVIVGDPSDNISGIAGFGETTWKRLTNYTKDVLKDLCENPSQGMKDWVVENCSIDLGSRAANALKNINMEDFINLTKVVGFRKDVPNIKMNFGTNREDIIEEKLKELFI